ncbi:MAG: hypothetical protein EZS28_034218, partial [Streblomastix strix]
MQMAFNETTHIEPLNSAKQVRTNEGGSGGGMYIYFDIYYPSSFLPQELIIHECRAIINTDPEYLHQSGFAGGFFLCSRYSGYPLSTDQLNFRGLKAYGNVAENYGQSLYVVMNYVKELCRLGLNGEYVKGNYSDIDSDESELEGIVMEIEQFDSLQLSLIIQQQKPLEYWWKRPYLDIWHLSYRQDGLINGQDNYGCGEYNDACQTISFAFSEISILVGDYDGAVIPEKKIGICSGGYDLVERFIFRPNECKTNSIKIMKERYGTKFEMEGQAQILIKVGNGRIYAASGMRL